MSPRSVLHVDMNAYFASIEQKCNPLLRGKPIAVVADSRRRSVVMTASYEARRFGVKTGMNLYEARKVCPQVIAVDGNSDKYRDATWALMAVFESFTDQVEMTSCDEAFLDVTGSRGCFRTDGEGIGRLVKDKVRAETGLPCSVGVAPNKLLAKLGSDRKKPDGLTVIRPESVETFLADIPVEDLSGVGRKLKEKLNRLGILTCGQLGAADEGFLRNHFGFWGHWLKRHGQGLDEAPVKRFAEQEAAKSVGHSTTFPRNQEDMEVLKSYLMLLSEKVAARMRRWRLQGRTVSLYVRYSDFTGQGRQRALPDPVDDGFEIYSAALGILEEFLPLRLPVRLFGVSVSSLVPTVWQGFLFEAMQRKRTVNETVDALNREYGFLTVKPARLLCAEQAGILQAPVPPGKAGRA